MQSTKNYQLNQWEASDRILRTDFNADNEKIDAALQQAAAGLPICKLQEIKTSADTQQIDIDLSKFDWETYRHLLAVLSINSTTANYLALRLNGISGSASYSYIGISGGTGTVSDLGSFLPSSGGKTYLTAVLLTGGSHCSIPSVLTKTFGTLGRTDSVANEVTGSNIQTLNIFSYYTAARLQAGSQILLYGVRI